MANVLMVPASGSIIFDSQAAQSSIISPLSAAPRLSYDNAGGLNITSYTTATSALDRFSVDGASGRLFSVSDSLTGIIFSVNDASGLPVIEVESNLTDKITIGAYGSNALVVNDTKVGIGTATPNERLAVIGAISSTNIIYASGGNSNLWNSTYNTVSSLSANWSNAYTTVNSISANGATTYTTVNANSANWGSAYTNINASSARFNTITNAFTATSGTFLTGINGGGLQGTISIINGDFPGGTSGTSLNNLGPTGDPTFRNLTVTGNLSVTGDLTFLNTNVSVTSALSVVNAGTGPALYIKQSGNTPIAYFLDADGTGDIIFENNGFVGLGTASPNNRLTVVGVISSTNIIYAAAGNSDLWNSTYTSVNANSANGATTYTTVNANSANWSSVYSTVCAASANYILAGGNSKGADIIIGTNDNFNLNLETSGTTKMTVTSSGNIGIGTTTPSTLLHLRGGVSPTIKIEGYDAGATYLYPSISFQSNNNQGNFESAKIEGYGYHPGGYNALNFYINDTGGVLRRMWQLDSLGNIVQNPGGSGGSAYNNTGIQFTSYATGGTGSRFIQVGTCLPTGHPGEMLKLKAGDANSAATGALNFGGKIFVYGGKAIAANATPKDGDVILAHDSTIAIGNVGIGTSTPTAKLDVVDTTLAGSSGLSGSALNISQTWSTSGSPTAIKLDVTDTSSNAASLLMDLRVGARSSYAFGKTTLTLPPSTGSGIVWPGVSVQNQTCSITRASDDSLAITAGLGSGKYISVGGTGYGLTIFNSQIQLNTGLRNVYLSNDDNHILTQRNGGNPQAYRLYNTYTDATTFERLNLQWQSSVFKLGTEKGSVGGLPRAMELQTDGTTRMTITTGGNVGIGTTSPTATLQVAGNAIFSGSTLSDFYGPVQIFQPASSSQSGATALTINSSIAGQNNVAIKFGNSGGGSLNWQIRGRSSQENDFGLYNGVLGTFGLYFNPTNNVSIGNTTDSGYKLDVTGTMRISGSAVFTAGNVGIGTTTPNERLTVVGVISSTNVIYASGGNSNLWNSTYATVSSLSANNILDGGNLKGANITIGTKDNFNLNLETANTTRMTVTSAGNVGVGTTTPSAKLQVEGNIAVPSGNIFGVTNLDSATDTTQSYLFGLCRSDVSTFSRFNGMKVYNIANGVPYAASRIGFYTDNTGYTASTEHMTVSELGNIGIGITTPTQKLDVVGNIKASGILNNNGITDLTFTRIINPGGGAYSTTTASVTGAIAITFPVGMTNTMLRLTIKVYEYETGESFEIHCGGYNYLPNTSWFNTFAYIVGQSNTNRNFTIRFGYTAGGKSIVYIGELASAWVYPQVFVTEVQCGYSGLTQNFTSGWTVGFTTAAFENVTQTISNAQIGQLSTTTPAALGTAAVGTSTTLARADHVHAAPTTVSGNAGTATTLQTARLINGVSFNGSADITVPAAAGTLTGNTLASGVTVSSLTSVGTLGVLTVSGTISSNNVIDAVGGNSNLWNSTYATVNANSASWSSVYSTVSSLSANYILDGGNTKGANLIIGTNDAYAVSLETNGTTRMSISANGLVSIDSIPVSRGSGSNNTNNIAIGGGLTYNTTGVFNTSLGRNALSANTTGNYNVGLGLLSLQYNKTGERNTAVGSATLQLNSTGGNNTSVGNGSLQLLTGSLGNNSANTAVGQAAMGPLDSGSNNIAIGRLAGYTTGADDGDGGFLTNTVCDNSIFIGADTGPLNNSDTNEIVIGYGILGTGSNTTTINNGEATMTTIRGAAGHVLMVEGDIELPDTYGVILVSPDLTRWKITVNDDGSLQTTAL